MFGLEEEFMDEIKKWKQLAEKLTKQIENKTVEEVYEWVNGKWVKKDMEFEGPR